MKFVVSLILMALLAFAAGLYFPWWSIAITSFIVAAFIRQRPGIAFLCGFTALLLLWGGLSFWISYNNHDILATKVSAIILKKNNPGMLILVTALIGAIVSGFAALSGSLLRSIIQKN